MKIDFETWLKAVEAMDLSQLNKTHRLEVGQLISLPSFKLATKQILNQADQLKETLAKLDFAQPQTPVRASHIQGMMRGYFSALEELFNIAAEGNKDDDSTSDDTSASSV